MNLFEFFKLKFTLKNYTDSTFLCWKTKSPTFWDWSPLQKLFHRQEKVFETRIHFPRVAINFRRAGKNLILSGKTWWTKSSAKNFRKKTNTLWITSFQFNCSNNIKRKRLWAGQIFMEKNSKGEFNVLVKELNLFDPEFFFKHTATRHFDFSQPNFIVFVLFNNVPFLPLLDSIICKRTICRKIFLFNYVFICFWVAVIYKSEIP